MKRFNKLIAMILTVAFLVSAFSVLAFAEDGEENTDVLDGINVLYNRDYEEGWDATNGFTDSLGTNKAIIDSEIGVDQKYNYFTRFEHGGDGSGYFNLVFGSDTITSGNTVISFDIMSDDACEVGEIASMATAAGKTMSLLYINNGYLYALSDSSDDNRILRITDEWSHVDMIFDWDYEKEEYMGVKVIYGDGEDDFVDLTAKYATAGDSGMRNFYLGFRNSSNPDVRRGMSFCIDNLQVYQGEEIEEPIDIPDGTYGVKVDPLREIVVDIKEYAGGKSTEELLAEALCMKIGVPYALVRDQKTSIAKYNVPTIVDGKVMVPLMLLLEFIGYPYYLHPDGVSYDITTGTSVTYLAAGRDSINVDGEKIMLAAAPGYLNNSFGEKVLMVAIDDIPAIFPGWLLTYDDMGLIIMYEGIASEDGEESSLISRENDLDTMLAMMKKFVFNNVIVDDNGKELETVDKYEKTGEKIYNDATIHSANAHPYIIADQAKFDSLKATYNSDATADNAAHKTYINNMVAKADEIFANYAKVNEGGTYIGLDADKKPVNLYNDGKNPDSTNKEDTTVADTEDGYNSVTKALYEIEEYTEELIYLAFAYQMTEDAKYAGLAYELAVALGEWMHWGPGYMPNCANAGSNFAIALDWLYNAYTAEEVAALEDILYNQVIRHGYNSSKGIVCANPRSVGEGDAYTTLENSTNIVCSSGMIISALAMIGNEKYHNEITYLVGNNVTNLIEYGLGQYAPDGSYIESPKHWEQGTNAFMKLIMAMQSAVGDDYGFANTWGLDKTFYYALYIEDSDGNIWNYHDGGADGVITGEIVGMDTQMFNFAGYMLGDDKLIAIRQQQLNNGKEATLYDVLFYPEKIADVDTTLKLDYFMEGIDAFITRSSWENGALYVGLMGGLNDCAYGQIDSGNFIYRDKGITWFMDLGSDDPNVYSATGQYRYYHYRNNGEGQNIPIITSAKGNLPYGQDKNAGGSIVATGSNEYGSYALLDNTSVYGSAVTLANRGVLVTNNRTTFVLQDEISLGKSGGITWIAHTAQEIEISEDGKTAYLTGVAADGVTTYILRATILSRMSETAFTAMEANAHILDVTYKPNDSANRGGAQEYSRTGIKRLAIVTDGVLQFNVAVVFELVDEIGDTSSVGYEFINMNTWVPSSGVDGGDSTGAVRRGTAVKMDIKTQTQQVDTFYKFGVCYGERFADLYKALTTVEYTLKTFDASTLDASLADYYSDYLDYQEEYDEYAEDVNDRVDALKEFADILAGVVEAEEEEED